MSATIVNVEEIRALLTALQTELLRLGDRNWVRGIAAALDALDSGGVEKARAAYLSMNRGVGSFADYNFWLDDYDARRAANQVLNDLRDRLWQAFEL
jgi:hypothetical protein